jgi:hypothetical protein
MGLVKTIVCRLCVAGIVAISLIAPTARAVVVSANYDAPTLLAPADNPGWNNVARMSGASAVYLGDRWMITADHVSDGQVLFSNGTVGTISYGSDLFLQNGGNFSPPDLRLFRLVSDPGLPTLAISASTPANGSRVMMIGAGDDRAGSQVGWTLSGNSSTPVWTQVPALSGQTVGYLLTDTNHMRWGVNAVSGTSTFNTTTPVFNTTFDRLGLPFEAQASRGDSGGGVFQSHNGAWSLAGIIDAQQLLGGQPSNTLAFGDQTLSVDLSVYRAQIESVLTHADSQWQNQVNRFDVNRSGNVDPHDVLILINNLNTFGTHTLSGTPTASDWLVDVNNDGIVAPSDVLQLINVLSQGIANPPALTSALEPNVTPLPEPSAAVLALLGLLTLALGRRFFPSNRRRSSR